MCCNVNECLIERPTLAEDGLISKIVPGAVTFQNRDSMTKMSAVSPVGTLAYVIEEEALLVRVNNGWQYIAVSYLTVACDYFLFSCLPLKQIIFLLLCCFTIHVLYSGIYSNESTLFTIDKYNVSAWVSITNYNAGTTNYDGSTN